MTKNKKIQLLTDEVKALQSRLDILVSLEINKPKQSEDNDFHSKKALQLIKELEIEKMQYRELRKKLEETKKEYELMYNNRFNTIKSVFFKQKKGLFKRQLI